MTMFDLIDDGAQFAAQLHTNSKQVHTTDNLTYPYDYLIVAAGARHSYFGDDESEAFAPGLKNLEDVIELRRCILSAFEAAEIRVRRRTAEPL